MKYVLAAVAVVAMHGHSRAIRASGAQSAISREDAGGLRQDQGLCLPRDLRPSRPADESSTDGYPRLPQPHVHVVPRLPATGRLSACPPTTPRAGAVGGQARSCGCGRAGHAESPIARYGPTRAPPPAHKSTIPARSSGPRTRTAAGRVPASPGPRQNAPRSRAPTTRPPAQSRTPE